MSRIPGWRSRLNAYVESKRREPFQYGINDCATFAAGAVEAMTGSDPAALYRGTYATEADGNAALVAAGYPDVIALAQALYTRIDRSQVGVGDLVLIETPDGAALGVCGGARCFAVSRDGLLTVDLVSSAVRRMAFRI